MIDGEEGSKEMGMSARMTKEDKGMNKVGITNDMGRQRTTGYAKGRYT